MAAPGLANRLLTLTGPGGTGKTRLALQVAGGLLESFPDGIWWVELAALNDPILLAQTIAGTLGLPEQPGSPPLAVLLEHLRDKRTLVVLDNCEHLVAECARICHALLAANPATVILATSRESLNIAGEVNWPVSALSLPMPDQTAESELMQSEAVRLFIERAKTILPGFELAEPDWPLVGQLCVRLDGLPLAIELAAARVNLLSVSQLVTRLDNRFKLLTGGSRATMPRHQTLQALVDWSYDLLTPAEQTLFRRLGVFVGGWSLEAAESVGGWGELEPEKILDLQHHLVNKSLVVTRNDPRPGAPPRYFLLETLRQYALKKLADSLELSPTRQRHFDYFLDLAEKSTAGLRGPEQAPWMEKLELENDNLRAGLGWTLNEPGAFPAVETGQIGLKLRMPVALIYFWANKGTGEEWKTWLDKALAATATEPPSRLKSLALAQTGMVAGLDFDNNQSGEYGRESLRLARQLGDKYCEAWALLILGQFDFGQEGLATDHNLESLQRSLALFRELGAAWEEAYVLGALADLMCEMMGSNLDKVAQAIPLVEQAIEIMRRLGDGWRVANNLISLTILYTTVGRFEEAAELFERSKSQLQQPGVSLGSSIVLMLGVAARFQGRYLEAADFLRRSLEITQPWHDMPEIQRVSMRGNLAFVEIELGEYRGAWQQLQTAFQVYQKADIPGGMAWCVEGFAFLAGGIGQPELAVKFLGCAEMQRELAKQPMNHNDRQVYTPKVEALKTRLGLSYFEKLWSEGRGRTLTEIFALAGVTFENLPPNSPAKPQLSPEIEKPGPTPTPDLGRDRGALAGLTAREVEVLRLVARGLTNSQVAQELVLSTLTVNAYLRTIYSKLNVTSRAAATRLALENHLI